MQDHDPLSPGHLGSALAVAGLVVLMLGEPPGAERVAAAAGCLVAALAAFAAARLRRRARGKSRRAAPARGPAPGTIRLPGDVTLTGQWSMPLSQRDPLVHPALSMHAHRFRGDPPAPAEGAERRAAAQD